MIAKRIIELEGVPVLDPQKWSELARCKYDTPQDFDSVCLLNDNVASERCAILRYLQAAVNPYITILGPIDSAAKRISIMGICNKLAWPIPPLFLAFLIGKEVTDITVADLFLPFYVIIAAFIALGIIAYMAPLPEVKAVGDVPYPKRKLLT